MFKTILGIETSCDETAAAVLEQKEGRTHILSNIVSSSASLQEKYGGVLPEQAAREQLKMIIPVIEEAVKRAFPPPAATHLPPPVDAIAVTYGPGLIGSLLVGVETAKTLAQIWDKPLIPVNHLLGHFYANWIDGSPVFPSIGLLISGGHTDLVLFKSHHRYKYLGGTRDDAAGECLDKCARLLGLSYPGGPKISELAQKGNPKAFNLPRPMIEKGNFSAKGGPAYGWDFSFSGLKTAVANLIKTNIPTHRYADLAASLEQAIVDVLVKKCVQAAQKYKVKQVVVAGGVAANNKLRRELKEALAGISLSMPEPYLCTDNGAMVASRAFFENPVNPLSLQADPSLSLAR